MDDLWKKDMSDNYFEQLRKRTPEHWKLLHLAELKDHGRQMKEIYLIRKNPVIGQYLIDLYNYINDFEF